MKKDTEKVSDDGLDIFLQELRDNPFQKFNVAFSLMSVIPFLAFFYLLAVKFFSLDILIGDTGVILSVCLLISLCGLSVGYGIIRKILFNLIAYAAKAKRSDQLKSTFVATVSHDLKNPIAILKESILNILDGIAGPMSEDQKKLLGNCRNVTDRMNRLVNDLLDLHKIEAGVADVKRKLCDMAEIINGQVQEMSAVAEKKRINLIREVMGDSLLLWADKDKIERVINNILANALKYTPEEGRVQLKAFPSGGFVRVECADNGPGIPSHMLSKVFDKFERLAFDKEGTGLGLSISKDIVEMHKGRIWAESMPGEGSTFVMVLPRDLRRHARQDVLS